MANKAGGKRPGAGRKKGSKNKTTIAKEVIGEIIGAPNSAKLDGAIHQRGHALLLEMERIVLDPTQPVAARIMAAKTALPFLLSKRAEQKQEGRSSEELMKRLQAGRARAAEMHAQIKAKKISPGAALTL